MNASSQTPGPLPGYINLQTIPASPDVPAHLVVQRREPLLPMCADCGNRRGPLRQRGGERYPSGAQVLVCPVSCPPTPSQAATGTLRQYDAETVEAIAFASHQQAKAENAAELAAARQDREATEWFHSRWRAAGRLCEGRDLEHMLTVGEILTALDGQVPTRAPLTVTWDGIVADPAGDRPGEDTLVAVTTARGGQAVLVLADDQRLALGGLLLASLHAAEACPMPGCGMGADELDASDPTVSGWICVQIAGTDGPARWWCSPWCMNGAVTAAVAELAEADSLDARYGIGASDEYDLQVAEAAEAAVEDERGRDDADQEEDGAL